jgi:hypothetical protein
MIKLRPLLAFALFCSVAFLSATAADSAGTWTKKAQKIAGNWTIENGQIKLTGLSTRNAPDLKIFLSPQTVDSLSNKNAEQNAVFIADLKSNQGDQSYPLPPDLDLAAYKSIIIHCKKYPKLWGAASL